MNWDDLRAGVYHVDGSWRDIYVLDANTEDWAKWAEYVNANYRVRWFAENYNGGVATDKIDAGFINYRWESEHYTTTASIFLDKIQINCHFFTDKMMENDINPMEIQSLDDHARLMDYMKAISTLLGKEVILTEESSEKAVWIKVNGSVVLFTD